MAFLKKLLVASIFVFLVVLQQVQAVNSDQEANNVAVSETSYSPKMDCGRACTARCQLSRRPRLCKRACGTCCMRCNCVPLGTYGNLETCPCYANITTHNNRRKCP